MPNVACNLARATHAPNLVLIYESGAVGAVPERIPESPFAVAALWRLGKSKWPENDPPAIAPPGDA
jgi:hypothetical protein